jgi:ADP-ribose pyrophosphatase YjhB (NUDIX family)
MQSNANFNESQEKRHPMPFVRLELVVLAVRDGLLHVLLSHRKEAPHKGKWGLPGGALRIDLDGTLWAGAQRVATERLGRTLPNLGQVATVGGARRDPRAPWAMSVIFRSLVQPDIETTPGKRVQALEWRAVDEVISVRDLAFDHAALVAQAVEAVGREVREFRFPEGWVPAEFTLGDLQAMCEAVLRSSLDKVTFRRRIDSIGLLRALPGRMRRGSAHRPAQLYAFSVARGATDAMCV